MTFFRRTKVLSYIIYTLFFVLLAFSGISLIGLDFADFFANPAQHFWQIVLFGACTIFGVCALILFCVRRDAQEDLKAAFDYAKTPR